MTNSIETTVQEMKDAIERKRIGRLSRGSVRAQNGYYQTEEKWKELRDTHSDRLLRVSKAFYPEKY